MAEGYLSEADDLGLTIVTPHQQGVYQNLAAAVQMCDFVIMLPGWARKGGTVEDLVLFISMGKPVFFFDPGTETLARMSPGYIGFSEAKSPFDEDPSDSE
jgi:hypothetical protein